MTIAFSRETDAATISRNFAAAKVAAILAVAAAHYFPDSLAWVAAEIALILFAFSSGYFTARRYPEGPRFGPFWRAKLLRLGAPLLVIDLFLCALFLAIGRPGVVSGHTPLALFGLSGFYDWIGVHNQSAFGNGLWFFTVLILFYLCYPLLAVLVATRTRALATLGISAVICVLGVRFASPHYALWQVVFGFICGVYVGRQGWRVTPGWSQIALGGLLALALALNAAGIRTANPILIVGVALAAIAVLLSTRLPAALTAWTLPLQACVLEIYFLHTYLFLPRRLVDGMPGFILSLLLIVGVAWVLNRVSSRLDAAFFAKARPATQAGDTRQ